MSLPLQQNRFLTRRAMYLPPLFVQTILQKTLATNVWSLSNKNILVHFSQDKKKKKKDLQEELFAIKFQPLSVYTSLTELFKYFLSVLIILPPFKKIRIGRAEQTFEHSRREKCFNLKNHLHENCKLSRQKWRTQLFMQHNRSKEIHGRSD